VAHELIWKAEADEHDYPAAASYLSLLAPQQQVDALVADLIESSRIGDEARAISTETPATIAAAEVLIAASRKEKVEDRVAVAEAAGLKALVMDVESYAVQTAFDLIKKQFPDDGKDQNIALVDIGANVMNVTVLRNDQTVYTREQAFGGSQLTQDIMRQYGMSQEEAENAKRTGGLPDSYEAEILRPFLENLALEVQRAMQFFFTSTQYNSIEHILLTGGSAVIPGLEDIVGSRSQVNTRVANPFASMQVSPRIQPKKLLVDAPSMMVACGLAMRRFDP